MAIQRVNLRDWAVTSARLCVVVAAMSVVATTTVSLPAPGQGRNPLGKSIKFVPNEMYDSECTPCHLGFLPGFLPQRSWKELMATLSNHFGEDASLGEDETKEILEYLMKHSADTKAASPRSKRIARMIPKDEKPLRITETPFWERRHYSIKRYVFDRKEIASKAKCEACHRDAAKGIYTEYDVDVPK
jgi:hypothetical protein